jgi:hypothetical protein
MIYYQPTTGDPHTAGIPPRPRHCFLMTQLGGAIHPELQAMRDLVERVLGSHRFTVIDADSQTTGRDFLMKIWGLVLGVPMGVALIHESMTPRTLSNIFYELGLMHAYGKETLVLKSPSAEIPSDFVRTEYIAMDARAEGRLDQFMDDVEARPDYYGTMADQLESNPLLSIDYLRRAYLVCGEESYRERAREYFESAGLTGRAKNSVEVLLAQF